MAIPRGTTPKLQFRLRNTSEWSWGDVITGRVDISRRAKNNLYSCPNILLTKSWDQCRIDNDVLSIFLTEEETLAWKDQDEIEFQVCVVLPGNNIMKSGIVRTTAGRILNESVMPNG